MACLARVFLLLASFTADAQTVTCNVSAWADVKLVCGPCRALINRFENNGPYKGMCANYCKQQQQGLGCVAQSEEPNDDCVAEATGPCDVAGEPGTGGVESDDMICECAATAFDSSASSSGSSGNSLASSMSSSLKSLNKGSSVSESSVGGGASASSGSTASGSSGSFLQIWQWLLLLGLCLLCCGVIGLISACMGGKKKKPKKNKTNKVPAAPEAVESPIVEIAEAAPLIAPSIAAPTYAPLQTSYVMPATAVATNSTSLYTANASPTAFRTFAIGTNSATNVIPVTTAATNNMPTTTVQYAPLQTPSTYAF
jgi:hypothetical protein